MSVLSPLLSLSSFSRIEAMVVPLGSIGPDWPAVEASGGVVKPDILGALGVFRVGNCASLRRMLDIVSVCVLCDDVVEVRKEIWSLCSLGYIIFCRHSTNNGATQVLKGQQGDR
jgi:hypothetical protein